MRTAARVERPLGTEHHSALRLDGVVKQYGRGAEAVRALDGVDLDVRRGTFTA